MDKNSLLLEIDGIVAHCNNGREIGEDAGFSVDVLARISSLSKKRRLPEGFVMSLFKDRLEGNDSLENMKQYYKENRRPTYSSRTPAWVKIAISALAKTA